MNEAEEEIASAFSFPDLPTVEHQIRAIEAPIQARYADEIALDPEVVDEILRTGSNRSKGQLRLIYNFMVEKTPEEYTEFVKNEYGTGGKGFEIDGSKYAVWFDNLGLRIAAGDTAKGGTIVNAFLSWEDVSNRIHELLRQGEYAPQAVLDAARQNALQEHAQTLAYMERDLADGVAEAVFRDTEIFRGGFPELTDRLAGLLDDTDFLTDLNERLSALGEAYNGNLVRWFEDYYPISNNETAGIDFLNENGTVDVYAVRDLESFSKAADGSVDPAGKLIGLKEFTQQEFDARDIEALKNSTSVAMAGTPLEDSETAKLVAEYEAFGVTYDAEKDQWYFNGEEVRYFRDVLTSNGESLTSGKFRGEMRTLGSGVGTIDIYTVRDYGHLNSEHHGTLTGIEKYSQEEFDEHTQAGMSGNQPIGNASHN